MSATSETPGTQKVPEGWQRVRLGEVADVAFSGVDKRTVEGELPVQLCNYTDVFYNRRIHVDMDLMDATATDSEKDKWTLRKGDVLFTKDSETPDEIGIPAFVPNEMPGVLCGYHLGLARPRKSIVDGAFLAATLTSSESRKQFARIANGVTRFGLTLDATKALHILLPPLPEQRAIAAVLDSIDDAIEGAEAVISATEGLRDALLHDLLTRGLPGQHTEFRDVPGLGAIPANWDVVRLGDVAKVTSGIAMGPHRIPQNNPKPYLTVANVQANQVTIDENRLMEVTDSEYQNRNLRAGDVVLVEGHAQISQLGRAAIVPPEAEGFTFQNHLFRVRMGELCDARFVAAYVNGDGGRRYFGSFGGTTSGLNTVSAANVRALPMPFPSPREQEAIAAALDGVDAAVAVARIELERLHLLKESTTEVLMTGRLRVGRIYGRN